jgi:hypothetical protein
MGWSNWVWVNKYYREVSMSFNSRLFKDYRPWGGVIGCGLINITKR